MSHFTGLVMARRMTASKAAREVDAAVQDVDEGELTLEAASALLDDAIAERLAAKTRKNYTGILVTFFRYLWKHRHNVLSKEYLDGAAKEQGAQDKPPSLKYIEGFVDGSTKTGKPDPLDFAVQEPRLPGVLGSRGAP